MKLTSASMRQKTILSFAPTNSYNIPVCLDHIPEIQAETLEHNYSVYFPTQMLSQIIKRVSHAAAQNDVRFYMNGVYLGIDNGQFIAVATDGHRICRQFS
ncbi:DNA polymerase III subunit beta family protein [Enterobacter asburiae]|uniref:DNA polymerase III subunit beta family protein n=1 Tax=Enterobacter asburiae TaxID=61645 RepID=UPI002A243295|nr:hypothetical protein [Enterobacter asburiae]